MAIISPRFRTLLPHLALHTATSLFSGSTNHGHPSDKAYKHTRTRQKMARASRKANR